MSELGFVTALYQSNLKTLQSIQTQFSKLQTKLNIVSTHKQLSEQNQELREKSGHLTDELIRLQLMRGHWHLPISDSGPQTVPIIVFPQKRACDPSQSEPDATGKIGSMVVSGGRATGGEKGAARKGKRRGGRKLRRVEKGISKSPEEEVPDISRVDFRVGKVLEVRRHPDADTLFVEKVDVGDGGGRVRQVITGLVGKIPMEEIQDRTVIVCCNLKHREMRSVVSNAMMICACAKGADGKIEFIDPPPNSLPGEPIRFGEFPHKPDRMLNPQTKILEKVIAELNTDSEGVANYRGAAFQVSGKGVCRAKTLRNTIVK